MRGLWYCLFASSPLWTLHHRTTVNHLIASDATIALSEAGGSVISIWDRGIKSSVVLPSRHVVDRLGFLSPSSLGAIITREDSPPLFYRIEEGRVKEEHPLSSSVLHMTPVAPDRIIVAHRIGVVRMIPNETDATMIEYHAGFSAACGAGSLMCASTFDGKVVVWDDLREIASYSIDPNTPITRMACTRISGQVVIVSTCFGKESDVTIMLVSGGEARTGSTVRIDAKEACSIQIDGEDVFVMDEIGSIHHFCLSKAATRHSRRFVFPGIRNRIIDNIAVTSDFLIHNEGSRVHVWPRRNRDVTVAATSTKMFPPASNPIIQQWLQAQTFLSGNTTQN